jgi:hypothetical protein
MDSPHDQQSSHISWEFQSNQEDSVYHLSGLPGGVRRNPRRRTYQTTIQNSDDGLNNNSSFARWNYCTPTYDDSSSVALLDDQRPPGINGGRPLDQPSFEPAGPRHSLPRDDDSQLRFGAPKCEQMEKSLITLRQQITYGCKNVFRQYKETQLPPNEESMAPCPTALEVTARMPQPIQPAQGTGQQSSQLRAASPHSSPEPYRAAIYYPSMLHAEPPQFHNYTTEIVSNEPRIPYNTEVMGYSPHEPIHQLDRTRKASVLANGTRKRGRPRKYTTIEEKRWHDAKRRRIQRQRAKANKTLIQ